MNIVVGYIPTPEGTAAFEHARELAAGLGHRLVVVNTGHHGNNATAHFASSQDLDAIDTELNDAGVDHEVRQAAGSDSAADVILDAARQTDAGLIVIGLRRRSPVGKMITGSTAQAILMDAGCPVLTVKPDQRYLE
ncbi:universal stress protein [Microlunatus soli]|uniref:Nucleotide-binding universal stress protein, UspA family n=1 Tax=Microlunatus soli TaxID=630515 RepID=A0A1H1ZD04_9ACTN|nr:universal stress protein [Microlunatus soli]SDT31661.1 Nucleotide-binding universal stress protein, UspA family [Microlunatus soli]